MTHTTPEIEEIVNLKEWRELQATLDAIWCERPVPVPEHDLLERLARSLTTKHQEEIEKALDGLMEQLADIEHERWSKWQNYLHSKLEYNGTDWVLKNEWFERWNRQIHTPYINLSEQEKESDREQVRPYLNIIRQALTPTITSDKTADND